MPARTERCVGPDRFGIYLLASNGGEPPATFEAASASRASAGKDFAPVFFMIDARWFSTVRWLILRSAAPAFIAPNRDGDVAVAGDHDGRKIVASVVEFPQKLEPAHPGKISIDQKAGYIARPVGAEKRLAGRKGFDPPTLFFQIGSRCWTSMNAIPCYATHRRSKARRPAMPATRRNNPVTALNILVWRMMP